MVKHTESRAEGRDSQQQGDETRADSPLAKSSLSVGNERGEAVLPKGRAAGSAFGPL
jgi:hypothetical protein